MWDYGFSEITIWLTVHTFAEIFWCFKMYQQFQSMKYESAVVKMKALSFVIWIPKVIIGSQSALWSSVNANSGLYTPCILAPNRGMLKSHGGSTHGCRLPSQYLITFHNPWDIERKGLDIIWEYIWFPCCISQCRLHFTVPEMLSDLLNCQNSSFPSFNL